jgi:hypothetical protein
VQGATKIIFDPTDLTRTTNKFNIDYIPNGETEEERVASFRAFSDLVTKELRLHKLSLLGNLEDRRGRLRAFLRVEIQIERIRQAIARGQEGKESALILFMQAIPCIMHLEIRVGEKLITVLLALGAELFQRRRGVKSLTQYAQSIQHVVNTRILGTAQRPKQWRLYLGKKMTAY